MLHLKGTFGMTATLSSDLHNIRTIYAETEKGYIAVATVKRTELTQAQDLATAELLCASSELRMTLVRMTEKVKRADEIQSSGGLLLQEDWKELAQLVKDSSIILNRIAAKENSSV